MSISLPDQLVLWRLISDNVGLPSWLRPDKRRQKNGHLPQDQTASGVTVANFRDSTAKTGVQMGVQSFFES